MRVCAVYDRIKIRYDKQKGTVIIMDKQTKKELLFFAAVFFSILIIGIMGGLLLFLLENIVGPDSAPSFGGLQNYIRLFFNDPVFWKALSNTLLLNLFPILSAVLMGYILSIILHKFPRIVIYIIFGLVMILAVGSFIVYRVITVSGDGYGGLSRLLIRLGILEQPLGLEESSLKIITLFGTLAFLVALGICVLFFTASNLNSLIGIKKIGVVFAGMIIAVFFSTAICGEATQLIGYPSADYSVHTIINHLNDYSTVRSHLSVLSIVGIIWKAELAVLMTLGLWGVDKLRIFLKNKLFLVQKRY